MSKFFSILILFTAFALTAKSQNEPVGMGSAAPGIVAKPSFETTESGLHMRVWIMSVVNDTKDIPVMEDRTGNNAGEAAVETHHVMVEVKDAAEGTEIQGAKVKMDILDPTGKTASVDLDPMMTQYGGNIPLGAKGEYRLKLNVKAGDGRTVETPFSYTVR